MSIAIVGAGIMGCTLARLYADLGHQVRLYERQDRIGGLCADGFDADGDFVQFFGPHIFHTRNPEVLRFVTRFGAWRSDYQHRVISRCGERTVPVPINATTLEMLHTDAAGAIASLYEPYSKKQWGPHWESMRETALARVRIRGTAEDRYFPLDEFQGFPIRGFSAWMAQMVESPQIALWPRTSPDVARISGEHARVYWTGRIDAAFRYRLGILPFRTIDFQFRRQYPVENLPEPEIGAVRRTHFGLLLGAGKPEKVLEEFPRDCEPGEIPTHPVISPESQALWREYARLLPENVIPVGRCAEMKYLDMDASIERAFTVLASQCSN